MMAEAVDISPSSVGRIGADAGLKPHVVKGFKASNDPMFAAKVTEIVGLWLHPSDRAVVLCVMPEACFQHDAKSRIQAPDRTRPGLPPKKGRAATSCGKHASSVMTHDDKRHGTNTLFATLDVKSGLVIGDGMPRHRAREFLTFLRRIDRAVKKPRDIHIVLDNCATRKTPEVLGWLDKHPLQAAFHAHQRVLAEPGRALLRRNHREAHPTWQLLRRRRSRGGLCDHLLQHNARPKPFVWSTTAEDIITRERRALDALDETRGHR